MSDLSASVPDEVQTEVSDVVLALREAVQDKNIAELRQLMAKKAQVCVDGRFLSAPEFFRRLEAFFEQVGQIDMDVIGVDRIELLDENVFATFKVDFAWIDAELWEERGAPGTLDLTLERRRDTETYEGEEQQTAAAARWMINGFHYEPRLGYEDGGGREPEGGFETGPRPTGEGGYFPLGIWG